MRKTLTTAGLIVFAAAAQATLASVVGVGTLHWWQWAAINAPVVTMGLLIGAMNKE